MKKRSTLDVLRHSRHDWLNRVQLIKANISLERWNRVNNLIEEIVLEANHESNLTNLHAHTFAEYLITFHWEPRLFSFEYEVLGDTLDLSSQDITLYKWISAMFAMLENVVNKKAENHLFLSLHVEEKEIRFFFEINGILENRGILRSWIQNQPEQFTVIDHHVNDHESVIKLAFSYV